MIPEKPILVLVCGGTIVMKAPQDRGLMILDDADVTSTMEGLLVEAKRFAAFEIRYLMAIDSTDMSPSHWTVISEAIRDSYRKYRAIVIVTGTNTLAYLSSALSFALQDLSLPIVITGSQLPASEPFSDARMNFLNSVRVALSPIRGVFVVFGHRVILGCRAKKVSESQLNAFSSFNSMDIGEIGIDIKIGDGIWSKHSARNSEVRAKTQFEENVVCVTLLPGMSSVFIRCLVDAGSKGLILRSFGSGDIPQELFPGLEYARSAMVPVINTTQCPGGKTMMGINDVGSVALDYGVVQAFDMSMEAMSTKLMWLLGQKVPYCEIAAQMQTNLVGELAETRLAK